jgi:hypothetical protein
MHNSRETVSTDALSGGSNLATTLSLNACPYLATSFFRYRPRVLDFIEATTILTQRAGKMPTAYYRPEAVIGDQIQIAAVRATLYAICTLATLIAPLHYTAGCCFYYFLIYPCG